MKRSRHFRSRFWGYSIVEILVVMAIFSLVSSALYLFFRQYSHTFFNLEDRLENVTETWQVLRVLQEDLSLVDCPDHDLSRWRDVIRWEQNDRLVINRMNGSQTREVEYVLDRNRGHLVREEMGTVLPLLRGRCKSIEVTLETREMPGRQIPQQLYFQLRLILGSESGSQISATSSPFQAFTLETKVFPHFLNQRLASRWPPQGRL